MPSSPPVHSLPQFPSFRTVFWRTGRGAILQGAVWDFKIPSFPLLLHDASYHIGQSYKVWVPGTPRNALRGRSIRLQFGREPIQPVLTNRRYALDPDEARAGCSRRFATTFVRSSANAPTTHPSAIGSGQPTVIENGFKDPEPTGELTPIPQRENAALPPRRPGDRGFADYLGEVQAFDAAVGVLLAELESMGELDNTIVW